MIRDRHRVNVSRHETLLASQHLDAELSNLDAYRQQILTMKNDLVPVCCLPPEILVTILSNVAPLMDFRDDVDPTFLAVNLPAERGKEVDDIISLIAASQVCRYWRNVALNCASIWANIWVENPLWTQEMAKRVRGVPLELSGPFEDPDTFQSICSLLSSSSPYRRLGIYIPDTCSIDDLLSRPAPTLEAAVIEVNSNSHGPFPSQIFSQNAPHLRHLRLEGELKYHEILRSPIMRNLIHLELRCSDYAELVPCQSELLDAIGQMPHLENLCLSNVLCDEPFQLRVSSPTSPPSDIVQLPNIYTLVLCGFSGSCANFAQKIRVHPECRFEFEVDHNIEYEEVPPSATVIPLLSAIPSISSPPIRALLVDISSPSVTLWNLPLHVDMIHTDMSHIHNLTQKAMRAVIHYVDSGGSAPGPEWDEQELNRDIVTTICEQLHLDQLQDLVIQYHLPTLKFRLAFWIQFLRNMPRLERLVLHGSPSLPVLALVASSSCFISGLITVSSLEEEDLSSNTNGSSIPVELPLLLPHLSSLCLRYWRFRPDTPFPNCFMDCIYAISSRTVIDRQYALQELVLVDCEVTEAQVIALREMGIAESVTWDGKTTTSILPQNYVEEV